jgi:hypothetical protein
VALYHNNRNGTFTDVTGRAGLRVDGFGMGVCAGDYDNDGWDDVYITCLGPNFLFHNNGDGTFTDVSAKAGVRGAPVNGGLRWKWSSSCAWVDYNRDGWLDLFVCNFVEWSPQIDVFCGNPGGPKDYCAPVAYKGLPNTLYRNNGNGRFTDVSAQTHIGEYIGKAWGVAAWDYNGDGWPDLAVTNDTEPNFLFVNHAGRFFTEEAVPAGLALSETGHAKAGMGIDVADWNNDGHFSLLIGNFSNEKLGLFRDEGGGLLQDVADQTGIGEASLQYLTFGLFFFDYDLDGWPDAFAADGHIQELAHQYDTSITYKERPLLFHNERNGRFTEVGERAGEPLRGRYVLRGCAWGDYDNDGDPDILVLENNGRARLWRNEERHQNHWLKVSLVGGRGAPEAGRGREARGRAPGAKRVGYPPQGGWWGRSPGKRTKGSNRDGIGALVTVKAGGITQRQWVKSGGSFMSQSSLALLFGLGQARQVDAVEVLWPSGRRDRLQSVPVDRLIVVGEGQGLAH